MAFIQFPAITPIFPTLPPLTWSVHKKPIMSSRAITAVTGRGVQVTCAAFPRWEFTLTYSGNSWLRDETQNIVPDPRLAGFSEFRHLSGLFLQCLGSYGEFYYEDPDDNSRTNDFVGLGNSSLRSFPFFYRWGIGPFNPYFTAPVSGIKSIENVFFNGVPQSSGLYSINASNTGIVFSSPPAAGISISASYHFYFRCRFKDDTIEFSQWAHNLWENKETRFESVKP